MSPGPTNPENWQKSQSSEVEERVGGNQERADVNETSVEKSDVNWAKRGAKIITNFQETTNAADAAVKTENEKRERAGRALLSSREEYKLRDEAVEKQEKTYQKNIERSVYMNLLPKGAAEADADKQQQRLEKVFGGDYYGKLEQFMGMYLLTQRMEKGSARDEILTKIKVDFLDQLSSEFTQKEVQSILTTFSGKAEEYQNILHLRNYREMLKIAQERPEIAGEFRDILARGDLDISHVEDFFQRIAEESKNKEFQDRVTESIAVRKQVIEIKQIIEKGVNTEEIMAEEFMLEMTMAVKEPEGQKLMQKVIENGGSDIVGAMLLSGMGINFNAEAHEVRGYIEGTPVTVKEDGVYVEGVKIKGELNAVSFDDAKVQFIANKLHAAVLDSDPSLKRDLMKYLVGVDVRDNDFMKQREDRLAGELFGMVLGTNENEQRTLMELGLLSDTLQPKQEAIHRFGIALRHYNGADLKMEDLKALSWYWNTKDNPDKKAKYADNPEWQAIGTGEYPALSVLRKAHKALGE
jgi:hypothetical protein